MVDAHFHESASVLHSINGENHNSVTSAYHKCSALHVLPLHW